MKRDVLLLALLAPLLLAGPVRAKHEPGNNPPPAPREFRGAWIASVGNSNWPSKPGLPVDQQKREMIELLDRAAGLHFNAVILQVRPAADALYASELEPWSYYLTGVQGQAPQPFWDPLATWIEEAHRRGMELHAWYNLYRARSGKKGELAANHVARARPDIVREYGNYLWMDPGEPMAQRHTLAVVLDIVKRYDVDGVHTDDYYYPYPVEGPDKKPLAFPDDASFQKYKQSGGRMPRDEWRRDNINDEVSKIYSETKKLKPWVKVGFSPFGIWQPKYPPNVKGLNSYAELYSDSRLWLNKGWLDYIAPQLYWPIGGDQDFPSLLAWWLGQNAQRRYIWPGMSVGKFEPDELLNQIEVTRRSALSTGQCLWNIESVVRKPAKADALRKGPYAEPALVPPMIWLDDEAPKAPIVNAQRSENGSAVVSLRPAAGERAAVFAIYARYGPKWHFTTVPAGTPSVTFNPDPTAGPVGAIVISAVDRCGNESPRVNALAR
jgi:uncharacterized lipoprotein YddW (UPF0748 family)